MRDSTSMLNLLDRRLVDSLYVEAMVLADEARAYFDHRADEHRAMLGNEQRVDFACESLKVTTRLMHVIAWLLTQRAILNGELPASAREDERYQLGTAARTEAALCERFKFDMTTLVLGSQDLYDRVAKLEHQMLGRARRVDELMPSPARDLLSRLERAF